MKTASLIAILALFTAPAWAQSSKAPRNCGELPGTFEGIAFPGDGDNVEALGFGHRIRLWGVQAPELRDLAKAETVPGMKARVALDELLGDADYKVRCRPHKFDHYCRVVASCSAGDRDLSFELVKRGVVYGFWLHDAKPEDAPRSVAFAKAEAAARKAKTGLWPYWLGDIELR